MSQLPKQILPEGASLLCPNCLIECLVVNGEIQHPDHTIPIFCVNCGKQISQLKYNGEQFGLDLDFYRKKKV